MFAKCYAVPGVFEFEHLALAEKQVIYIQRQLTEKIVV